MFVDQLLLVDEFSQLYYPLSGAHHLPLYYLTHSLRSSRLEVVLGSFSNDDGDGIEDVKKAIGLLRKTTSLHVHHAFLYISLPSLHDYDVKMPNCKFYGGRKQATTNLFFSL